MARDWRLIAATGCLLATLPDAGWCAATIVAVQIERVGHKTELHFKLRGSTAWHLNHHGNKLSIEFDKAKLEVPPRPLFGRESAPVGVVRVIDTGQGGARVTIEVEEKTDYAVAKLPDELLVRLAPAGSVPNLDAPIAVRTEPRRRRQRTSRRPAIRRHAPAIAPLQEAPPLRLAERTAPAKAIRPALVIVDAGHGGFDPGTRSGSGMAEKDYALAIANRLNKALNARGVSTGLTRDGDYFLKLGERTEIANRAGADLFISIHLNWSTERATAGIEAYYLNNTTDRATIRLARMENDANGGSPVVSGAGLNYILADLRQNYKAAESASLAQMVEHDTAAELEHTYGATIHELGAKKGPFYVLVGAHMPAVLIECGFLSNPQEAQRLAEPRYQEQLAQGIAAAVVHYLNSAATGQNL